MPTTKLTYYWEGYKRSIRGPLGWTQFFALFLAVVGALVGFVKPDIVEPARLLLWLIPTCTLLLLMFIAGSRACYELYRELEWQHDQSKQELVDARQELAEQQASRMRRMAGLICQCKEISSADDARFVLSQVSHFLRNSCGGLEALEFERILEPITEDSLDDTDKAGEIRNNIVEKAVEYLKRVRQRGVAG